MTRTFGAIDIGGTKALAGLFSEDGALLARDRFEVGPNRDPDDVTRRLSEAIQRLAADNGCPFPTMVGVSVPGPLTRATGIVHLSPNLGWRDYPLGERLASLLGTPVVIDDDANCAALGEAWRGAGRGVQDFVLLIVGSGIGSGIVRAGEVYHGAHDSAGEIGHAPVLRDGGALCGCGKRGCLESLASGSSIARRGRELVAAGQGGAIERLAGEGEVTAEMVFSAAEAGDESARHAVLEAAAYLGQGLAILVDVLDPEAIILGGGLGLRGGWFLEATVGAMRRLALPHNGANTQVLSAALGGDAGLYGAARMATNGGAQKTG